MNFLKARSKVIMQNEAKKDKEMKIRLRGMENIMRR